MTTHIKTGDTFLGYPVTKLRSVLRSFAKGKSEPSSLAHLASIKLSPGAVTAVLAECLDRNLVTIESVKTAFENTPDGGRYIPKELSTAGLAITAASAKKRSTKDAAGKVLDAILENAAALAQDTKAITEVVKIWVFGSFIDPAKEDVGDLDIVIERSYTPVLGKMGITETNRHLEQNYPGTIPESTDYYRKEDIWFSKMIFGARRHHLVAENNIYTLQDLYRPCSLVFDKARGGIIAPIHYDHHPESTERSERIKPRLEMPDLSPSKSDFVCIDVRILQSLEFGFGQRNQIIITSHENLPENYAKLLKAIPLDGRNDFAVAVCHEGKPQAVFHVSRKTTLEGAAWHYDFKVDAVYYANGAELNRWGDFEGAALLTNLYYGDLTRLADKRASLEGYHSIYSTFEFCDRAMKTPGLVAETSRLVNMWFNRDGYTFLPEERQFSIEVEDPSGMGWGLTPYEHYTDEDWSEMPDGFKQCYYSWLEATDPDMHAKALSELAESKATMQI